MAVKVGDTFSDSHADGMFKFEVVEVQGKFVLAVMEDNPDWGPVEKAFTVKAAEGLIGWQRTIDASRQQHNDFWANVQVGRVIHYHNGFGEYVRGVVIERDGKRQLDPVALVGDWKNHWEYHWAKLLRRDGAWQPSSTCVYEAPDFVGPRGPNAGVDPTTLAPLDFTEQAKGNDYFRHCLTKEGL